MEAVAPVQVSSAARLWCALLMRSSAGTDVRVERASFIHVRSGSLQTACVHACQLAFSGSAGAAKAVQNQHLQVVESMQQAFLLQVKYNCLECRGLPRAWACSAHGSEQRARGLGAET